MKYSILMYEVCLLRAFFNMIRRDALIRINYVLNGNPKQCSLYTVMDEVRAITNSVTVTYVVGKQKVGKIILNKSRIESCG